MSDSKLPYKLKFNSGKFQYEQFYVLSFDAIDNINKLFEYKIKVLTTQKIELSSFLTLNNSDVTFEIQTPKSDFKKQINGICSSARFVDYMGKTFIYELTVSPVFKRSDIAKKTKVFMDITFEQMITKIFDDYNFLKNTDYRFDFDVLNSDMTNQEQLPNYDKIYACQYNETDFEFIKRWCQEYGVSFYFQENNNSTILVFSDHNRSFQFLKNKQSFKYDSSAQFLIDSPELISSFTQTREIIPANIKHINNDLSCSTIVLDTDVSVSNTQECDFGEQIIFGGNSILQKNQDRFNKIEDERVQNSKGFSSCNSNINTLIIGSKLQIQDHLFVSQNDDFVITKIAEKGSQISYIKSLNNEVVSSLVSHSLEENSDFYSNVFQIIHSDMPIRPKNDAIKPIIGGVIVATITDDRNGKTFKVDESGSLYQVKLPFNDIYSPDGYKSCWLNYIGEGGKFGSHIVLEKGEKVLIGFFENNIDRPVILGSISQDSSILEDDLKAVYKNPGYTITVK